MTNKQTTPFTRNQVSAYISEQGTKCPVCGRIPTSGEPEFDPSIPALTQRVTCFACGTRWIDVWTLTNAIILDDGLNPVEEPKQTEEIKDQFEVLDQYEEYEDRYTWGWEKE